MRLGFHFKGIIGEGHQDDYWRGFPADLSPWKKKTGRLLGNQGASKDDSGRLQEVTHPCARSSATRALGPDPRTGEPVHCHSSCYTWVPTPFVRQAPAGELSPGAAEPRRQSLGRVPDEGWVWGRSEGVGLLSHPSASHLLPQPVNPPPALPSPPGPCPGAHTPSCVLPHPVVLGARSQCLSPWPLPSLCRPAQLPSSPPEPPLLRALLRPVPFTH